MRVLWFTNSPARYMGNTNVYNGGGWITSLEDEIVKRQDIQLGVAFLMSGQPEKVEKSGVVYYPFTFKPYSKWNKLISKFHKDDFNYERKEWHKFTEPMLKIIDDFKPDIIEFFGSELPFSLVASVTKVPQVLHIQGLLTPYWNAYLPPFISVHNYIFEDKNPLKVYKRYIEVIGFKRSCWREQNEIGTVNNFIGRTEWSRRIVNVYNPKAKYFYGGEILRDVFYGSVNRVIPKKLTIVSTISQPLYKGFDLALKTAKLLKEQYQLQFEWKMFGNIDPRVAERMIGINHHDVAITLCGVASAEKLKEELEKSTVYVHTAYIENSPNSVCEAQILGVPVIATMVGGVPSLIKEGKTGFLCPANDPYQMAFMIKKVYEDNKMNMTIGEKEREVALKRHDRNKIVNDLIETYKVIIDNE